MNELVETLLHNWIAAIVLIALLSGIVTEIVRQIRKYGCHAQEVALKRELVERGLSVDEIERIIAAKGSVTAKDA